MEEDWGIRQCPVSLGGGIFVEKPINASISLVTNVHASICVCGLQFSKTATFPALFTGSLRAEAILVPRAAWTPLFSPVVQPSHHDIV
jgi:hypothetical protein